MGDAQAPGGYFVGRPANYEDKQRDAAADAQTKESAPAAGSENQAPAPGGHKKTGFLGNLFSCFSGGRVES
ncbi:hypothetical protein BDA96_05G096300 [Sorghum bicolor]|uniref:Uncharacterized protein n=1 Tax=Sorghum bicolor TaxID=4558 RepID=A0A921QXA1_SORBI|nr:hypothetical protein BDA96_05G096300 [Sorghum bicolor]